MASEPPNPSWHPALMPDHHATPDQATQRTSRDSSPDLSDHGTPLDTEPRDIDFPGSSSFTRNAWRDDVDEHEHDHHEGGAFLPVSRGSDAPSHTAQSTVAENEQPMASNAPISKHSSSLSFARTVSHEITFGDDDEGDFSLPRTNTDPFKFMPSFDRSNSFPAVPPLTNGSSQDDESQPLPTNQAMDIMEETERDLDHEKDEYQRDLQYDHESPDTGDVDSNSNPTQPIGGEIAEFEGQAAETRFEEGVPLISHTEAEVTTRVTKRHMRNLSRAFAEDTTNDDFFGQISDSQGGPPTLQRKSTAQVLGSLTPEVISRQNTLHDTLDEEDESPELKKISSNIPENGAPVGPDLSVKWQEAFGGGDEEEELLPDEGLAGDENLDTAAFLGSDDEGLLDDDVDDAASASQPSLPSSRQVSASNPYLPQNTANRPGIPGYGQGQQSVAPPSQTPYHASATPYNMASSAPQYGRPGIDPGQAVNRTQSFADKSKGGYASPYDLPTDLITNAMKPRKRASTQSLRGPSTPAPLQPPPPGMTMGASTIPPMGGPPTSNSRPSSGHGQGAPLNPKDSGLPLRNKSSFFEDLPMTAKPRPGSRQSLRAPSPAPAPPPPQAQHVPSPLGPPSTNYASPPPGPAAPTEAPPGISNLVAPPKVSPYATLQQSGNVPPPASTTTRYSPSPTQSGSNGAPLSGPASRYSPAPSAPRQNSSYSPTGASHPSVLPHQPRTSSPLAHFEVNAGKPHVPGEQGPLAERRASSSSYETRLNRMPSLPPTREVEEEDDDVKNDGSVGSPQSPAAQIARQTSPAPAPYAAQAMLSPTKRSSANYVPQQAPAAHANFAPPARSQTQSPGASRNGVTNQYAPRPSSAHSAAAQAPTKPTQQAFVPATRGRGQSMTMNMVSPTDGREQDPLQRWSGVPIFAWGVGGTIITTFPKSIPRYVMNQSTPTISRVPGEVKIKTIKDIDPLPDRLIKFPGPLKGKSKKKETVAWLSTSIETLEKSIPDVSFHSELSLEAKRTVERLTLWKILRVFIEFDGTLEGTPAVEKAVRDVLVPEGQSTNSTVYAGEHTIAPTSMQADGADIATMEQVRQSLVKGDREAAVWLAADKRLWGHAMLIANTVSPGLYRQVSQEFVRKEVNYPGHNNESMAAFYKILSGNHEDCVDELVPSHARAGFQLMSTAQSNTASTKGTLDGLDKWRETLSLVLSNRSTDDIKGLLSLGNLLASYGRAEAAHVCFMFSRQVSVFGGLEEPNVNIVLLGSDHRQQTEQFGKETEALELSEVYEYGLSLTGGIAATGGAPHLAGYKFQHAVTLVEHGYREKAMQYCDSIAAAATSQTKRSPYYSPALSAAVDDFMTRLKQAPKGETNSWISKPSMNKVSDSMWSKFNKFVAGDEGENNGNGVDGEKGPFGNVASPTISRSPSVNNFETFGTSPSFSNLNAAKSTPAVYSKYAPVSSQAGASSNPYEPSAQYSPGPTPSAGTGPYGYSGAPSEPGYPGVGPNSLQNGQVSQSSVALNQGYSSYESTPPSTSQGLSSGGYQSYGLQDSPSIIPSHPEDTPSQGYQPPSYGFESPQMAPVPEVGNINTGEEDASGGYEPPSYQSYGYEPPTYRPDEEEDGEPKAKKKSFMDDDDDDIPALRPGSQSKEQSKSDKDKENDEMFRKAAEEDAQRAEADKANKKGWGFGGWFGKKPASPAPSDSSPNKPIKAKLGEASSFVYDPDLKRWVNKKPGAENVEAKTATPPPPRAAGPPRSVSGTPPPTSSTPPPPSGMRSTSGPLPPRSVPPGGPTLRAPASQESLGMPPLMPPMMSRSGSQASATGGGPPSAPPSRPTTGMSNASSIEDLIGAAGPRKAGAKKAKKGGRYIDVMAKD